MKLTFALLLLSLALETRKRATFVDTAVVLRSKHEYQTNETIFYSVNRGPASDGDIDNDNNEHDEAHGKTDKYTNILDSYSQWNSVYNESQRIGSHDENEENDDSDSSWTKNDLTSTLTYSPLVTLIIAIIASCMSFVTICGNILVITAFIIDKNLRKYSNYFILNLSIADLFIGLLIPPYAPFLLYGEWKLGRVACTVWLVLDYVVGSGSVLCIVVISLDRYLLVSRGLKYVADQKVSKAICIMVTVWVIAFLNYAPAIVFWEYLSGKRTVKDGDCQVEFHDNLPYLTATACVEFFAPFISITVLNVAVYLNIRKRSRGLIRSEKPMFTLRSNDNTATAAATKTAAVDAATAEIMPVLPASLQLQPLNSTTRSASPKPLVTTKSSSSFTNGNLKMAVINDDDELDDVIELEKSNDVKNELGTDSYYLHSVKSANGTKASPLRIPIEFENDNVDANEEEEEEENNKVDENHNRALDIKVSHENDVNANDKFKDSNSIASFSTSSSISLSTHNHVGMYEKNVKNSSKTIQNQRSVETTLKTTKFSIIRHKTRASKTTSTTTDPSTQEPFVRAISVSSNTACSNNNRNKMSSVSAQSSKVSAAANTYKKTSRALTKDKKAARSLFILVFVFVICWAPYTFLTLIKSVCPTCVNMNLYEFTFWLLWFNSTFNPILYPFLHEKFRKAFYKILTCVLFCFFRGRSHNTNSTWTANNNTALNSTMRNKRMSERPSYDS